MIIGLIHKGSGLGDQLFSYIATRVRAADLGVDFGFVGREFFKGKEFMQLDWGKPATTLDYSDGIFVENPWHIEEPAGKIIVQSINKPFVCNKPYFDPDFDFIEDGTIIDGYGAQDTRYFGHRLDEIREWLKIREAVKGMEGNDNTCIINFRGGEFKAVPELYLGSDYWDEAIRAFVTLHPNRAFRFEVHTDDPEAAVEVFDPILGEDRYFVYRNIEINWRAIRYAKHLIISNSAFAIIPALLNENVKEVIAPKYWNRRNIGRWDWPMNYYKKFTYV